MFVVHFVIEVHKLTGVYFGIIKFEGLSFVRQIHQQNFLFSMVLEDYMKTLKMSKASLGCLNILQAKLPFN